MYSTRNPFVRIRDRILLTNPLYRDISKSHLKFEQDLKKEYYNFLIDHKFMKDLQYYPTLSEDIGIGDVASEYFVADSYKLFINSSKVSKEYKKIVTDKLSYLQILGKKLDKYKPSSKNFIPESVLGVDTHRKAIITDLEDIVKASEYFSNISSILTEDNGMYDITIGGFVTEHMCEKISNIGMKAIILYECSDLVHDNIHNMSWHIVQFSAFHRSLSHMRNISNMVSKNILAKETCKHQEILSHAENLSRPQEKDVYFRKHDQVKYGNEELDNPDYSDRRVLAIMNEIKNTDRRNISEDLNMFLQDPKISENAKDCITSDISKFQRILRFHGTSIPDEHFSKVKDVYKMYELNDVMREFTLDGSIDRIVDDIALVSGFFYRGIIANCNLEVIRIVSSREMSPKIEHMMKILLARLGHKKHILHEEHQMINLLCDMLDRDNSLENHLIEGPSINRMIDGRKRY